GLGYEDRVEVGIGVRTSRVIGVENSVGGAVGGAGSKASAIGVESNNPMMANCPSASTCSSSLEIRVNCNNSPGNISWPVQYTSGGKSSAFSHSYLYSSPSLRIVR